MMKKNIALGVVVVLTFAFSAQAIIVENFSFEEPGGVDSEGNPNKYTNWEEVPGWSSDIVAADSGAENNWPGSTEGDYAGYLMSGDPSVWQLTDALIEADTEYILKVDAQNNWSATPPGTLGMILYYDLMGLPVPLVVEFKELTDSWDEYTMTFSSSDVPASVGKQIGIEMINVSSASSWIGIDNVRLVPEPASMLLLGLGGLLIRRKRR